MKKKTLEPSTYDRVLTALRNGKQPAGEGASKKTEGKLPRGKKKANVKGGKRKQPKKLMKVEDPEDC